MCVQLLKYNLPILYSIIPTYPTLGLVLPPPFENSGSAPAKNLQNQVILELNVQKLDLFYSTLPQNIACHINL